MATSILRRSRVAYSVVRGRIWLNLNLIQALVYVIITCKLGARWHGGYHLGLRIKRLGVRAPLGSPCCVLEQDIFTPSPQKSTGNTQEAVAPSNMTEKLFTGTFLSIKPNQTKITCKYEKNIKKIP